MGFNLLSFSANLFATDSGPCSETLYRLASYAFPFDRTRTESDLEFWKNYKAQPDHQEIDMRAPITYPNSQPLPWYEALVKEKKVHPRSPRPSNYEITLLGIRHGSKLIYDSQSLTLGKFLGAGNSSHIYQLATHPELAVRLPFGADAGPMYQRSSRMEQARELARTYEMKRPSHKRFPVVQIIDSRESQDFTLVEYIDVKLTALDFLNRLSQSQPKKWTSEEEQMLASLIHVYSLFAGIALNPACLDTATASQRLRQWAWSESRQNWILLDWE